MLGSADAAQDATQQVFANAYRDLAESDRELEVKPWLYAIARNHCISVLRSRRPEPAEVEDVRSGPGADLHSERRQDVRDLLQDVSGLPERQRAAVVMSTLGGFSHAEIAITIGCEAEQVKAILFQARTALSERAEAREASCSEIREQLRVLRGGSLRRNRIRLHLEGCENCRNYREAIRRERLATSGAVAVAPLTWSVGLAKTLLAKLGVAGSGLGEHGVAQLAAAALAMGAGVVGVVGVAGVASGSDAPPSEASLAPSEPQFASPPVSPPRSVARPPGATATPAQQADAGGSTLAALLGLLSSQGVDLSALLGEDGLLDVSALLKHAGAGGAGVPLSNLARGSGGGATLGGSPAAGPTGGGSSADGDPGSSPCRGLLGLGGTGTGRATRPLLG